MAFAGYAAAGVMALAVGAAAAGCGTARAPAATSTRAATGSGLRGVSQLPSDIVGMRAPRIALPAAEGGIVDTRGLRRPYAVTFLYAHCPDVCPLIADEIRQALTELGPKRRRVSVFAVSVDPDGDTRPVVRAFARTHRLPRNFSYLIGSRERLAPIWGGYFAAPQAPGQAGSAHTANVWLVDRGGRIAGKIDAGTAFDPGDLAHDFEVLLAR
jgi:protein SCO1/2